MVVRVEKVVFVWWNDAVCCGKVVNGSNECLLSGMSGVGAW